MKEDNYIQKLKNIPTAQFKSIDIQIKLNQIIAFIKIMKL